MSFFTIIPILGFAMFFRNFNEDLKKFDLFFSISFITFFLFIFGLLNFLKTANYFLIIIGFLIFFYFILFKKKLIDKNLLIKYLIFFILSFTFYILMEFFSLKIWDEFFWAQFTKSIYIEGKIYTASSILQNHPRYTPGIPLFQSFFQFSLNNFNEKLLFFSSFIIIIAQLLIFFEESSDQKNLTISHKIEKLVYIFIFFVALFLIFNHGYLYVELYLSLSLFSLIKIFYDNNINYKNFIFIVPIIFFVFLIKETSFVFIIFFILIILFNKDIKKNKTISIFFIFTCLLIKLFWDSYVYYGGANSTNNDIFLSKLLSFFLNFFDYIKLYTHTFNNYILDYGYFTTATRKFDIPDFTSFTWIIISLLIYLLSLKFISNSDKKLTIIIYFFGIFYYLFVFFVDYVFWDGKPVHFNRLSSTFLMVLLFLQISFINKSKIFIYFSRIFLTIIFIFLTLLYLKFEHKILASYTSLKERSSINNFKISSIKKDSLKILDEIKDDNKIYFIHQASSGFERTVFNFFVHPNTVNSNSWSIGNKYSKIDKYYDDIWTENLSINQFVNKLKNDIPYSNKYRKDYCCVANNKYYNYLFINYYDNNFINNYQTLFENITDIKKYKLFKIDYTRDGVIFLPIF